jgi:hypothetical protein
MKRINKKFFLTVPLIAVPAAIVSLAFANETMFSLAALFIAIAIINALVFHYKAWRAIPAGATDVTPAKAVWFLFIPLFNLYWLFRSIYGFAYEFNDLVTRHELPVKKLPAVLYLLQCILILVLSVLVRFQSDAAMIAYFVGLVVLYVDFLFITVFTANAVNTLCDVREARAAEAAEGE